MRCMVVSVTVFIYSPSISFTVSRNVGILMRLSRRNDIQFITLATEGLSRIIETNFFALMVEQMPEI